MKKRFNEQQIIAILKEAGLPVKELCRKHNIFDASRLKALEDENTKLNLKRVMWNCRLVYKNWH